MARRPDKDVLFDKVPSDGSSIGNVKLQGKLGWDDDKYWNIRNELVAEGRIGIGRGRGGSVFRILDISKRKRRDKKYSTPYKKEKSLYEPFKFVIEGKFTKEKDLKNFVCENTGSQGSRSTGGRWTRPDVVLVAVNAYSYLPGKVIEIITFELKLPSHFEITGVFETVAHTRFATRSYYCAHLPAGWDDTSIELERIKSECERFGLGLIYFTDPKDWGTYEVLVEPLRKNPDPAEMDLFISTQLSDGNKKKLSEFLH